MIKIAQKLKFPGTTPQVIEGPKDLFGGADFTLGDIVSKLLPVIFVIAGLVLFVMFIWGGFSLLISGGDPKKLEEARGKITNALIGFVIVFISYWLAQLLGFVFGLSFF